MSNGLDPDQAILIQFVCKKLSVDGTSWQKLNKLATCAISIKTSCAGLFS